MFNGKRLMIIELGKHNEAEELHIETRTTGSQDMYAIGWDQRVSVTMVAVRMGVEETGMRTGLQGRIQTGSELE